MRSLDSFPRPLKGILGTEKRELTQTAGIKLYFPKKNTKENTPIFLSPKKNPRSKYFQSETQQPIPKKFHILIHPQLRSSISNRKKMEKKP